MTSVVTFTIKDKDRHLYDKLQQEENKSAVIVHALTIYYSEQDNTNVVMHKCLICNIDFNDADELKDHQTIEHA